MKASFLFIGLAALLTVNPAAIAQAQRTQFCRFNGGERVQASIIEAGDQLKIEWSDGPKMTYTRLNVGPDKPNIVDNLGGYWYWNSHRDGVGFNLYNASNHNEIRCES